MSTPPVPKPRSGGAKKPVPLPRTQKAAEQPSPPRIDLFALIKDEIAERVQEKKKSVMETSRQIGERKNQITADISDKMHEGKRAVIETSRHITERVQEKKRTVMNVVAKRFGSLTREGNVTKEDEYEPRIQSLPPTSEIFDGIQFQSPLTYETKQKYQDMFDEDQDLPEPTIPPPPLPDESLYDAPSSISSESRCGTIGSDRVCYEEAFTDGASLLNFARNNASDTESDTVDSARDPKELHRSDSWSFYDSINTSENIYNNVDEPEHIYANETSDRLSRISVQNSLYENHILEPEKVAERPERPPRKSFARESTIREFDPLADLEPASSVGDLSILETLLGGDTYGTIGNDDDWFQSEDDTETDIDLPTPPQRFDSLPVTDSLPVSDSSPVVDLPSVTDLPTVAESMQPVPEPKSSEKTNRMFPRLSEMFKLMPPSAKNITRLSFRGRDDLKAKYVTRPLLNVESIISHQGDMIRVGRNLTVEDFFGDLNPRWCHLKNAKLMTYTDKSMKVVKETIYLESVLSIQLIAQNKVTSNNDRHSLVPDGELYCFEIATTSKGPRGRYVFGTDRMSDRRIWIQKILEALTPVFPSTLTSDYSRAGWVYLREGASGDWKGAWLVLHERKMIYCRNDCDPREVDLRKARCIVFQEPDGGAPKTDDSGPLLLVDCAGEGAIYIRSILGRTTRIWRHAVRCSAHNNGLAIDQQQLTSENVPVIVDKCINFVYAHGSMSEGIYRRSGSDKTIAELLTLFRHDAWSVQLTKESYSENDVACVLKRFFRNLPDPIFTTKMYLYFCKVSEMSNRDEKVDLYKRLLEQLPLISYQTIRKLMAHLHFIQSQESRNQMSIKNLSTLWGPTLMIPESSDGSKQFSKSVVNVISDLISLKSKIWPADDAELARERTMLAVLERYYNSSQPSASKHSPSGDLRVWVHLHGPNSGQCFNIAISPQKTANDICCELSKKMSAPPHRLQLEESVLGGNLTRPIHYTEKVLDVVLRWGYWDEADRKDNCLVLRENGLFEEISADARRPAVMSGELKYADNKSKSFKNFMFEFSRAKLSYYKDKNCSIKLGEWPIEDIIWYVGHEQKRDPHARWCVTFIPRLVHPKRTKATPWFGNAIAGSDRPRQLEWIAAMAFGEHPCGLVAPAIHVNLIENF